MKSVEEIIKGLECCIGDMDACRECPYKSEGDVSCTRRVKDDALELIRLLQAENDSLAECIRSSRPGEKVVIPITDERGRKSLELIRFAVEGLEGFEAVCTANALERLCYWKKKEGVEDLRKAEFWIEELITEKEG